MSNEIIEKMNTIMSGKEEKKQQEYLFQINSEIEVERGSPEMKTPEFKFIMSMQ